MNLFSIHSLKKIVDFKCKFYFLASLIYMTTSGSIGGVFKIAMPSKVEKSS